MKPEIISPREINKPISKGAKVAKSLKGNKQKNRGKNPLTHYCCECNHSSIQTQLTANLRNRLSQLKAPMGKRERQSRNLSAKKPTAANGTYK